MPKTKSGFTIVELLIVIVVIGILATIAIIAYSGIQQRAQDAKIRSVASQFAKAFQQWSVESGKITAPGGSGSTAYTDGVCVGGGGGWVTRTAYACTIDTILAAQGYVPSDLILSVPATKNSWGASPTFTLMLYGCPTTGTTTRYAMMYSLNTPDPAETANVRNTCVGGGAWNPLDLYKMNGGFVFSLSQ